MKFEPIATAPISGDYFILQDENSGRYEVAQWRFEASNWVRESGEPIRISPTHWARLPNLDISGSRPSKSVDRTGIPSRRAWLYRTGRLGAAVLLTFALSSIYYPG